MTLPPANLRGTYEGSCVVCMKGTDTGVAFRGDPEWPTAALVVLGVPEDQAGLMVSDGLGCEPGQVPAGEVELTFCVCQSCADKSGTGMKVGLVATGVPCYLYDGPS